MKKRTERAWVKPARGLSPHVTMIQVRGPYRRRICRLRPQSQLAGFHSTTFSFLTLEKRELFEKVNHQEEKKVKTRH